LKKAENYSKIETVT